MIQHTIFAICSPSLNSWSEATKQYKLFAANMTQQMMFGGQWTYQKLQVLKKYLSAYTKIFMRNARPNF